jgi:hypothetical protein
MNHGYKFAGLAAAALALTAPAQAALTLTTDGVNDGFTLSLVIDQVPNTGYCCGPLGLATNNLGQIVMQDYGNGRNYVFTDANNQHFGDALSSAPFASFGYGAAITNAGGQLYATNSDAGSIVYALNADGSVASALTGFNAGGHGIWTNPATGHLVAAWNGGINDINPGNGTVTPITNVGVDGVSVSNDGTVVYGADFGHVYGWNYSGTLVYDSGYLGSPDGTGVVQGNNMFSGDIIANANDGTVWLLDPLHGTSVVIATGGTRGDYVGLDYNDGSLLLTQTDSVYRLSCGPGCTFTPPVPEPDTAWLLGGGLGVLAWLARARKRG